MGKVREIYIHQKNPGEIAERITKPYLDSLTDAHKALHYINRTKQQAASIRYSYDYCRIFVVWLNDDNSVTVRTDAFIRTIYQPKWPEYFNKNLWAIVDINKHGPNFCHWHFCITKSKTARWLRNWRIFADRDNLVTEIKIAR